MGTNRLTGTAMVLALLTSCSDGGKSDVDGGINADAAGDAISVQGDTLGSTAGTIGTGGAVGSGGVGGAATGGTTVMPTGGATGTLPAGGDHFCKKVVVPAAVWTLGVQQICIVSAATTPPLVAAAVTALNYACTSDNNQYLTGTVESSCSRTDVVGYCDMLTSPISPYKQYKLVYKSVAQPDTATFSVGSFAVCAAAQAYDAAGNKLSPKCTGKVSAKIDGQLVDLSEKLTCTFKTDGVKSQYFLSGNYMAGTVTDKRLNFNVLEEGGKYSVPGNALAPGVGYGEGNMTFAFPKDNAAVTVSVTSFKAAGAGLKATFSAGDMHQQPGGKGAMRTITEGSIDITMTP